MKQTIKLSGIILVLLLAMGLAGCQSEVEEAAGEVVEKPAYIEDHEFKLDTIVTLKLYGEENTGLLDNAFSRIDELESMLSVHLEESDMARVQAQAGRGAVEVQPETLEVMTAALSYAELSAGHFDPTAGPLIDLWGIDPPEGHVATADELAAIEPLIDYHQVVVDQEAATIELTRPGMIANLGAIAKGFIADQVKAQLVDAGVESAIINLGGNVLLIGGKPDGSDFRIGVQDPDSLRGEYLGIISMKDESIVTSGDYERYFEEDGKRYHHILDPFTGLPADNKLRSVTIISKYSTDGDALSTTCFLLGLDGGAELIRSLPDIEAIFVTKDEGIYFTSQALFDRYQSTSDSHTPYVFED